MTVQSGPAIVDRARELLEGGHNLLIGGEWLPAKADPIPVVDPSTGGRIGDAAAAGEDEVARAVVAGTAAAPGWAGLEPYARQRALEALAAAVEEHAEELALLDALDTGNPLGAMRNDVTEGVKQLRFLAGIGLAIQGGTHQSVRDELHYTVLEPYGVVGRILPYNHPAMFAIGKLAAPLIAGNTVVLKPPHQAPLSAIRLGQLIQETLPEGVVNIVTGGATTGNALVTHPDVKRIAFTGSVKTGLAIQRAAAEVGVKSVSLELGGKNAQIVLPDADVAQAVEGTILGMNLLVCQGQSCGSNSRILVHRSLFDEFQARLEERLAGIKVGAAYDPATDMGPLISSEHLDRVSGYISWARDNGIEVAFGGGKPAGVEDGGYFLEPTVLVEPPASSRVAQEEIFGPVMSLMAWSDLSEAVKVANSVEYGLTASVWTNDVNVAHSLAQDLQAGYVWINEHGKHYVGAPFGGKKASGVGREESIEEIISYCEQKSVHLNFGATPSAARPRTGAAN